MRTVTIGVPGIAEAQSRSSAAFRGVPQGPFVSFASVELLWTVMTPQRWELLRALVGRDSLPLTDLADALGRNAVRADIGALRKAGIIESGSNDRIGFPFGSVHVDFTMGRAA